MKTPKKPVKKTAPAVLKPTRPARLALIHVAYQKTLNKSVPSVIFAPQPENGDKPVKSSSGKPGGHPNRMRRGMRIS